MKRWSYGKVFLRGLATLLPVILTVYLLWWFATSMERWLGGALAYLLPEGNYPPGLGLVLGVVITFACGLLMYARLVRRLFRLWERLFERVPLIKTIYAPLRDLMRFLVQTEGERRFGQVVMVEFEQLSARLLGFVTSEEGREVSGLERDAGSVAVYLPMSYQIGGFMVLVPRSAIEPVDISVETALRLAITAGMSR